MTLSSLRAAVRRGGVTFMTNGRFNALVVLFLLAGCATVPEETEPVTGWTSIPPPQEALLQRPANLDAISAISRIFQVDDRLHSVIAIDPTWTNQAARSQGSGILGPL